MEVLVVVVLPVPAGERGGMLEADAAEHLLGGFVGSQDLGIDLLTAELVEGVA
jgi:hypothetical protein